MKENYESITCEVVMFDTQDVISTSITEGISGTMSVTDKIANP